MKEMNLFREVAGDPHAYAEKWKADTGRKVVGNFCTYTPGELIFAAGALPFRIFGARGNISLADAHLQAYSCSLVRGGLAEALSGKLGFLDATVFPHTCDSIQRLSDIWRMNAGVPLHLDIVLPVKVNTESAREYARDVFKTFRKKLEFGLDVEITDARLMEVIEIYNGMRQGLKELYELRSRFPAIISSRDVYAVLKAAMVMDPGVFSENLTDLLTVLNEKKASVADDAKKRILITGGICDHPDFYGILEEAGASVAWDDLCTGSRFFEGRIDVSGDMVEAIANRYIRRVVCPAKYAGAATRGENLLKLAKEREVDGVIFLFLKFCDPQGFDYPYMKEFLDKEKVPNMLIEIEDQLPSEGWIKTRFEAFVEML
ncbi:MAG: 2-hydroxyacyl-CoA dehydratase [Desulfobacterales bacterium]|nr:2-hydroxyacyl-CoA dehydratase [Desulfobacterales bacterium]